LLNKENYITPEEKALRDFERRFYYFLYGEQANEMLQKTIKEFQKNTKYSKQMQDFDRFLENWEKHIE